MIKYLDSYLDIERLNNEKKKEVCIFGAGKFGRNGAYDLLRLMGISVDFYCDNFIPAGTVVRDNVKVRELSYLYANKKDILVFLCILNVGIVQKQILEQLKENEVEDILVLDKDTYGGILESIDTAADNVKSRYSVLYDDESYLKYLFKKNMGYELDINEPKTFNEKLQWLKLHDRRPEYTKMVDKYELKKHIAEVAGEQYIIPTIGVWDSVEEIEWDRLPEQFVIKCTHDSGSVAICKDDKAFDYEGVKEKFGASLKCNYYWFGREWPYKNVKPRIIAEEYLQDIVDGDLKDYKIHCFHGKAVYIQVDYDRFTNHKRNIYTTDWQYIDMEFGFKTDKTRVIEKPDKLEEMIYVAEKLSAEIPYVRIDLYYVQEIIYVGEITFYHGSGYEYFLPEEMGETWGRLI